MNIHRSAIQFQCSAEVAKIMGLPASYAARPPVKRDLHLPSIRKLTARLKKKRKSKKTPFDFGIYIMGLATGLDPMQSAKNAASRKEDNEPKAALAMETIGENVADEGVKVRRCQAELQSSLDGQYWTMQPTTGRAGRKRKQTVFFSPSF